MHPRLIPRIFQRHNRGPSLCLSLGTKVRHTLIIKECVFTPKIIIQALHVLVQISRKQWGQGQWMV
jgi:hypothetical protein